MRRMQIANPEKLKEFKFQIDGDPFVTRWVGANPELGGDNICWSIYNKNQITNEYRISLMQVPEVDDYDFLSHRVIIHSAQFATSRQIFVYHDTIQNMAEFSALLMKHIMQFEETKIPF
jgi:hypothetical protein